MVVCRTVLRRGLGGEVGGEGGVGGEWGEGGGRGGGVGGEWGEGGGRGGGGDESFECKVYCNGIILGTSYHRELPS